MRMLPGLLGIFVLLTGLPFPRGVDWQRHFIQRRQERVPAAGVSTSDGRAHVRFCVVYHTWASALDDRRRAVITDLAAWQDAWRAMTARESPPKDPPPIDLARET